MPGGELLEFEVHRNPNPVSAGQRASMLVDPGFGRVFTDHMVVIRYSEAKGWHDAQVTARAPIPLDPAAAVLHYAQEIFEGLKAYRAADGSIVMFRPEANAARFRASARRMAMPELPEEYFLESLRQLLAVDGDWIPEGPEGSLYLRPFMFASEVFLGVRPAKEYLFVVIASSVGPYFSGGVHPVTVWISQEYTRAAPGGTGAAKCGGNYAGSLAPQAEGIEQGCDQVVFLDAAERKYIEELGGMNVFFVFDDETLVTPPLGGTILPGITRESVIALATEFGLKVEQRPYTVDEWRADATSGRLREAFACGTAAVITPIGTVRSKDGDFQIGGGQPGEVSMRLRDVLVGIQRGRTPDANGWVRQTS